MKKNEEFVLDITSTGTNGEGVGKIDGFPVFVPGTIKGETVKVRIVKALKSYAFGKLIEIITPSDMRRVPQCPVFEKCGGCSLQHTSYEYELDFKREKVENCIKRIGGIDIEVDKCVPSPQTEKYRNKALFAVTNDGIGFYSARSHRLIDCENCIIQNDAASHIINAVKQYMADNAVPAYDEETHTGKIRNIFIRTLSGGTAVGIVSTDKNLPNTESLVQLLKNAGASSVFININSEKTNVAMGKTNIFLCGNEYAQGKIDGISFEISPNSFYQVNSKQTENLYKYAVEIAKIDKETTVFDLYCGIGTISLYAARYAKNVKGVEIVPEAVENAKANAKNNGISNAEFFCGKAEDATKALGDADVVIVDPPRKGCDGALLETIYNISPKTVVYISCDPATLARDLKILNSYGYRVQSVRPFDMFPRTFHVETCVKLCRK